MFVQFDKQKLHLQVICGTLESYSPSEEVKEAQGLLEELKKKLAEFQDSVVFPELKKIEDLVGKLNSKPKSEGQ
jgi:predicted nuclease with TOPRIM domain